MDKSLVSQSANMDFSRGAVRQSLLSGLTSRAALVECPIDAFQVTVSECSGGGDCTDTCPVDVFERASDGRCTVVNDFLCWGCMACVAQCLDGGVSVAPRKEPRYSSVDDLLR